MSFHPQTPQSPSRFSPATASDQISNLSFSGPLAAPAAALPTPAHSVNGSTVSLSDALMPDESSPQKRKRPLEDAGDGRHKKLYLDDGKLGIEDLHLDVGTKYLLTHTPAPASFPPTSDDLYQLFGLVGLAAEVAREKPNGEKNALRKTYKGHIKRLGVAGHFDVQKKREDAPSELMAMLQVPDLEWNVHQVKGRELADGLSEASLASLGRAMTMAKGPLPKSVCDTSVLGDLAPANGDGSKPPPPKSAGPGTPLPTTGPTTSCPPAARSKPSAPLSLSASAAHEAQRPRRNTKKRSYEDSSFEGYGDGFPDDDPSLDHGYSTGDGESGPKRRKKSSGSSPSTAYVRKSNYGPGMVGA